MGENREILKRSSIWTVPLLAQIAAIVSIVLPLGTSWRDAGILFFIIESILILVLCCPLFFFHYLHKGKPFRQSLQETVESLMNALCYFVP
jgi:hypothetical protein